MHIALLFLILVLLYFVGFKIIFMMYYRYFYYKMQGIPSTGFPFPIIGKSLDLVKAFYFRDEWSRGINTEMYNRAFAG